MNHERNSMILCVGLTPTVQRTLLFSTLTLGEVNRARETFVTASGKGVNVARVLTTLGGDTRLVQVLGGDSGRYVASALHADGIAHDSVQTIDDAPTRTCTTLLSADGPATELVEEARALDSHDIRLLRAAIGTRLLEAETVCLSGSLPPGVDAEFYADIVRDAAAFGTPVIVDAQGAPLKLSLPHRPFLVKPNREEAARTLGFALTNDAGRDARTAIEALTESGARWALVSMGRHGSLLGDGTSLWRIVPPSLHAVNPIGSGDSLTAGFLFAHFVRGMPVPEACAFGTACGAANCLTPTSGVVDPAQVERLLPQVTLTRL